MSDAPNRKDVILLLLALPGRTGRQFEPIAGRTRLMKLLYLLDKEAAIGKRLDLPSFYSFEAYHYGPFSKDVFDDIEFLRNVGLVRAAPEGSASIAQGDESAFLIEDETLDNEAHVIGEALGESAFEEVFALTPKGEKFVEQKILTFVKDDAKEAIIKAKTEYASLSLSSLLRYVYRKFPESATASRLQNLV